MQYLSEERQDAMGSLYNKLVEIVDSTELSPPETITVLRMAANYVERLFETSVKRE